MIGGVVDFSPAKTERMASLLERLVQVFVLLLCVSFVIEWLIQILKSVLDF